MVVGANGSGSDVPCGNCPFCLSGAPYYLFAHIEDCGNSLNCTKPPTFLAVGRSTCISRRACRSSGYQSGRSSGPFVRVNARIGNQVQLRVGHLPYSSSSGKPRLPRSRRTSSTALVFCITHTPWRSNVRSPGPLRLVDGSVLLARAWVRRPLRGLVANWARAP